MEETKRLKTSSPDEIYLNFEGSARKGNPGIAAGGWCVRDGNDEHEIGHGWYFVGMKNTNNEAEYYGLVHALEMLKKEDFTGTIHVRGIVN